jgi:hypothetical protein
MSHAACEFTIEFPQVEFFSVILNGGEAAMRDLTSGGGCDGADGDALSAGSMAGSRGQHRCCLLT